MKLAVIYVRVSTEEQSKHGISIETQCKDCISFAEQKGYVVKQIFIDEGLSAKNLNRPEVQKLIKYCNNKQNNINAIIVWRLDRLSRFCVDYHGTIRPLLNKNNISLLSATELNSDSLEGDYMRNMMMCNAEFELALIRKRTKENMKTIVLNGRFPAKAPIGYKNETIFLDDEKSKSKKIISVDSENAPFVKRAFELYATGQYSFKTLGDTLYREGFKHPKTGKKYPPRKFEWMLHNQFYIGRFEWDNKIYEGSHTPIITQELFSRVQSMFETIDRTKKHSVQFAYTGLIKCSECGCYLTAEFKRGKSKKGHYVYYHCTNSKGVHKQLKSFREEYFNNAFSNLLKTIHLTPEHIAKIRKLSSDYLQEFNKYEQQASHEIETQLKALNTRIHKSYIDKLDGRLPDSISDEEFNIMHKEWQKEKDRLLMQLQNNNLSTKMIHKRIDLILKFSEKLPELFLKANPEEKKLIISTMTKSIKFNGKDIIIELKDTFKALQNVKEIEKIDDRNINLRTLEKPSILTKNGSFEPQIVNGAGSGIRTHAYRNHNPRS